MIQKETDAFRYAIDEETFTLYVWNKDSSIDSPPFLEQPFNHETGETFTSVEDAETYFNNRYGKVTIGG